MAFQFNFTIEEELQEGQQDDDDTSAESEHDKPQKDSDKVKNTDVVRPAKELYVPSTQNAHEPCAVDALRVGDLELFFLNPEDVERKRQLDSIRNDSDVSKAIESHSDLIPNVYEGGLKVWECSIDLVNFLHEAEIPLENKRVLELGCGAGLPGIYAVKKGATAVHFQDYNEEVIQHMTIPSVMLNHTGDVSFGQDLRFFAGDWSLVQDKLVSADHSKKYDIILTSETIYSIDSHEKLYRILRSLLSPKGVVYIAAKTHYFGVGGGTRIFEEMVRRHGEFHIDVCKAFTEAMGNITRNKWNDVGGHPILVEELNNQQVDPTTVFEGAAQ